MQKEHNVLENSNFCPSLLRQKFFVHFLGKLKKAKYPFEINWPFLMTLLSWSKTAKCAKYRNLWAVPNMSHFVKKKSILLFYNILSDCHNSDEIYYLLNAFRLDKKILLLLFEEIITNRFQAAKVTLQHANIWAKIGLLTGLPGRLINEAFALHCTYLNS